MTWKDLRGGKVAAFVSGGLDSTTVIHWLTSHGIKVLAVTADLGQPDEKNLEDVPRRMKAAGATEAILVPGKEILARYMLQVIQGLGHYEGKYLNTTGIARMATVAAALGEIKKRGIKIITHGATGRGNDQVRFELAPAMLEPNIKVYAPWRDPDFISELGGRKQMIEYCHKNGLKISATLEKPYSTDANFCGLTHEAGKLESLKTPTSLVSFIMGNSPQKAPNREERVSIRFEKGVPVSVNGKRMNLVGIFEKLNKIAGKNGVGIGIDVVENRRIGIKSRGVYESPGASLLEIAYEKILELILDGNRREFFDQVSRKFAKAVYRGEWFSPLISDLLAVISNISHFATGSVTFDLYKGNVSFVKMENAPHSLYSSERSSMEKIGEVSHEAAQGYLDLATVVARALAYAKQTRKI
ncbi:MAG: argininosuccinate synthase [Candidatus Moranbacteria bacterium]|nr:argininosuccinate synthase [Candidatus Moranbacteria bacterium]